LVIALASVIVWTALALVALVAGSFGQVQGKILGSSMLATAAAVVGLACAVPIASRRLGFLPYVGIAASAVGFGLMILGIWIEGARDTWLKTAFTFVILAVAVAMAGLVGEARLRDRHRRIIPIAQVLIGCGAALLTAALWGEIDSEAFWRGSGVVLVLMAAAVVSVPILHRMSGLSKSRIPGEEKPAAARLVACPFCTYALDGEMGSPVHCEQCGRSFTVEPKPGAAG
jgi:hypothetical protein